MFLFSLKQEIKLKTKSEVDPDGSGPSESSLDDQLHLIEEEQMVSTARQYHPPSSTRDGIGTKMRQRVEGSGQSRPAEVCLRSGEVSLLC